MELRFLIERELAAEFGCKGQMIMTRYNSLRLLLRKLNDCIQCQDNEGDGVSKRSSEKLCNYATKSAIFTCYLALKT